MSVGSNRRISSYFRREKKEETEKTEVLQELKIQLERIDQQDNPVQLKNNAFKLLKSEKQRPIEKNKQSKNGNLKDKKQETTQPLRRSARNLPAELKENPKPVEQREPDIDSLPSIRYKGKIKYAEDFYGVATLCDEIIQEIEKSSDDIIPIGFDLEWPFSFQTGSGRTALAQICMSDKVCYLLHIYNIKKLPAAFIVLLNHSKVRITGVNIKNDIRKLGRDFKEFPDSAVVENNCIDSGVYWNKVSGRTCRWSLERLTALLLNKKIDKNSKVRRSKWHILPLSDVQKNYAATDAYVSWLLHTTIEAKATEIREKEEEEKRKQEVESNCLM